MAAGVAALLSIALVATSQAPAVGAASAGLATVDSTLTATPVPTVTGSAVVGAKLTGTAGTWSPAPVTLTYQWLRDGTPISAATATTYVVVAADLGARISLRVTGTKAGFTTVSRTSAETAAVVAGALTAATVRITGTAKFGSTLTAVPGTWTTGTTFAYVWSRDGSVIDGATSGTYVPGVPDIGKKITLAVTGSKPGYASATKISAATAVVSAATLTRCRTTRILACR